MIDSRQSESLISSIVRCAYRVSTIRRRCSAVLASDLWYYETIVWAWNAETRQQGEQLEMHDSGGYASCAMIRHGDICERLAKAMPDLDITDEAWTEQRQEAAHG